MSFFRNLIFGSSGNSGNSGGSEQQRKSSTTTTGPSFNTNQNSINISTGSVSKTTPHGSSLTLSGPNASVSTDPHGGGSLSPMGGVKGTLAVNQNTSLSVGFSPMSKSTTVERRKSNELSETTFNVPRTGISVSKTTYPQGNPQWNATSENQDKLHTNKLLLESRQAELQSIESTKGMMPKSDFERQRNATLESIQQIKMDTEKRSQNVSNTGSGSWFSFWK